MNFISKNMTGILLLIILVLASVIIVGHLPSTTGPGGMAPMGMTVKTYDLKPSDMLPAVDFTVTQDPDSMGGWDIHASTTNFTWTPENVNKSPVLDQGHAHLYVDGKMSVMYAPWYHIDDLSPGRHTLVVALAANDHSIYSLNGSYIQAQKGIIQK